ncbi:hypothetical protein EDC96DRAFT_524356 [Choanephora cucurbitarum]|nr:hypothetical protein EDC96DRAFT_524356 [Choanephora cucurbitarum]
MKFAVLFAAITVALSGVIADEYRLNCSCFLPKWDRGCCYEVGGVSKEKGNLCVIGQYEEDKHTNFANCCSEQSGNIKCKRVFFATS